MNGNLIKLSKDSRVSVITLLPTTNSLVSSYRIPGSSFVE